MASAPPITDLEHFFDLTMCKGGLRGGKLTRRMLWLDHKEQSIVLVYKEEETKAVPFSALASVEPVDGGARLTLRSSKGGSAGAGSTLVLTTPSANEARRLVAALERVCSMASGEGGAHATPAPPPVASHGRVQDWLMSGTVEKEGKLRWASRWLVLTRSRLYVLRSVTALCPLNVIGLDEGVRVIPGGRVSAPNSGRPKRRPPQTQAPSSPGDGRPPRALAPSRLPSCSHRPDQRRRAAIPDTRPLPPSLPPSLPPCSGIAAA